MPRKPSFNRDDLINRARDVFWARGWAGTSLKDLEETLKLKPGSFYAAFGSKDALYELALEKYAEDGRARLEALASEVGALEALKSHPKRILDSDANAAKACMLAKTYLELHTHDHPLADRADTLLGGMGPPFEHLFHPAHTDRDIAYDRDQKQLAWWYHPDLFGMLPNPEHSNPDASASADYIPHWLSHP